VEIATNFVDFSLVMGLEIVDTLVKLSSLQ
jgi:uncharacterized membrane protein